MNIFIFLPVHLTGSRPICGLNICPKAGKDLARKRAFTLGAFSGQSSLKNDHVERYGDHGKQGCQAHGLGAKFRVGMVVRAQNSLLRHYGQRRLDNEYLGHETSIGSGQGCTIGVCEWLAIHHQVGGLTVFEEIFL